MSEQQLRGLGDVKEVSGEFLHLLVRFTDRHEILGNCLQAVKSARHRSSHAGNRVGVSAERNGQQDAAGEAVLKEKVGKRSESGKPS